VSLEQLVDLDNALGRMGKGKLSFPMTKRWFVLENVHAWARAKGFRTAVVFKTRPVIGRTRYRLLIVRRCPWNPRLNRYYTATLSADHWL
jgi:hypothetical protein